VALQGAGWEFGSEAFGGELCAKTAWKIDRLVGEEVWTAAGAAQVIFRALSGFYGVMVAVVLQHFLWNRHQRELVWPTR